MHAACRQNEPRKSIPKVQHAHHAPCIMLPSHHSIMPVPYSHLWPLLLTSAPQAPDGVVVQVPGPSRMPATHQLHLINRSYLQQIVIKYAVCYACLSSETHLPQATHTMQLSWQLHNTAKDQKRDCDDSLTPKTNLPIHRGSVQTCVMRPARLDSFSQASQEWVASP